MSKSESEALINARHVELKKMLLENEKVYDFCDTYTEKTRQCKYLRDHKLKIVILE